MGPGPPTNAMKTISLFGLGFMFFGRFVKKTNLLQAGTFFASKFLAQTSAKISPPPNIKSWLRPWNVVETIWLAKSSSGLTI